MAIETNIFLVRHAQTEWNKQNRLQGNQDSPLTLSGRKQAQEVRKSLEQYSIDTAYASPLKRARDTMLIILKDRELEAVITDMISDNYNYRRIASRIGQQPRWWRKVWDRFLIF